MPIIYSVVARGTVILAEYSNAKGNFDEVSRRILEKVPSTRNSSMSYVFERHIFHYTVDDGLTYLCMADEEFGRRVPFSYLEDLKNRFKSTYGQRGKTALAFGMNEDFSRVMKHLMDYYSNNPSADKITKIKGEVDEVKNVMVHNIEKVLERGERIELLVDKTESMSQNAFQFKKSSTQLKRSMCFKNAKLTAILICIILVIIYVIVAIACGGPIFQKCVEKAKKAT
eukprot:TRINITY_DN2448_c0_g1_i1.p1 TRINITY_DN2448_c0_g1~~TRINITY_DN2448_c0_g1_i1.p1  ORF type:complete len:227 (+),score=56.28 TRINITY_DN2448_c0_g1_i1:69-749(+)